MFLHRIGSTILYLSRLGRPILRRKVARKLTRDIEFPAAIHTSQPFFITAAEKTSPAVRAERVQYPNTLFRRASQVFSERFEALLAHQVR